MACGRCMPSELAKFLLYIGYFFIITALFYLIVNSKHLENSSVSIIAASSARYKDFCRLEQTHSRKYCFAKVSYYSSSNASFQLQRLIRSGDTAESLNPGPNTLRCFLQNARSLKVLWEMNVQPKAKFVYLRILYTDRIWM